MPRVRQFTPDHRQHLGEARRDGTSYSPAYTHAELDAVLGRQAVEEQGRDGVVRPPNGIELPAPPGEENITPPVPVVPGKPCAVKNLVVTTTGEELMVYADISWQRDATCLNNGKSFEVELIRTDDPLESQFPEVRRTTATSMRFENLEPAVAYKATVVAISPVGIRSTGVSATFTSATDTSIPAQVTGLSVTAGFKTIVISWSDVADLDVINGNGTYDVQIATNAAFTTGVRTARKSGTVASFGDLATGTTYYARVRAIDSSGNAGAWSTSGSAATGALVTVDIADDAITNTKIADNAIETPHLTANAVTAAKIAANTITAAQIAANTLTAAEIAAGAITADEIAASAVTTAKLAADSVTAAKLAAIELEVGKYIQSNGYVAGSTGWKISSNGSAEFRSITARGTIISDNFQTESSGARVRMGSALTAADEVQFIGSSGGQGSIRNGQAAIAGNPATSLRLSAGGILDLWYDGANNQAQVTALGGIRLDGPITVNASITSDVDLTISTSGAGDDLVLSPVGELKVSSASISAGTPQTVTLGATDSGGVGYRLLRVPN